MDTSYSHAEIWQVSNSEYGERLMQIIREHSKLALTASSMAVQNKVDSEVLARIEELRQERESIFVKVLGR